VRDLLLVVSASPLQKSVARTTTKMLRTIVKSCEKWKPVRGGFCWWKGVGSNYKQK